MHPALILWYEELKVYENTKLGEVWKIKNEKGHLEITYKNPNEKLPRFATTISEFANPLKSSESTFVINCWAFNFHWTYSFIATDISFAKQELSKYSKILVNSASWFSDDSQSFAEPPFPVKNRSIYWIEKKQANIGISSFASSVVINRREEFKKYQRSQIQSNTLLQPIVAPDNAQKDKVLETINEVYKVLYSREKILTRAEGNFKTTQITKEWQERLISLNGDRYKKEYPVDGTRKAKQLIDLVDLEEGIAYELKVSGNNVHHEFYKDVFKILLANSNKLTFKKFVFITSKALPALADFAKSLSNEFDLVVEVYLLK